MGLTDEEIQLLEFYRAANVKGKRIMLDDAEFCAYKWPKEIIAYEVLASKISAQKTS